MGYGKSDKHKQEAIKRWKEFYYELPEAKELVNDLLNKGFSTEIALGTMRRQFAKEYFEWKQKKGYNKTWTDVELSITQF